MQHIYIITYILRALIEYAACSYEYGCDIPIKRKGPSVLPCGKSGRSAIINWDKLYFLMENNFRYPLIFSMFQSWLLVVGVACKSIKHKLLVDRIR